MKRDSSGKGLNLLMLASRFVLRLGRCQSLFNPRDSAQARRMFSLLNTVKRFWANARPFRQLDLT